MKSRSSGVWTILLFALLGCVLAGLGVVPQQWFREAFSGVSRADQGLIVGLFLILTSAVIMAVGHLIEKKRIANRSKDRDRENDLTEPA